MGHEDNIARGRVLIITAVEAERDAVLRGLGGDERFHVVAAGAGPAAAAAGTAFALAAAGQASIPVRGESAPAEVGPAEELLGSASFSGLEAAGMASTVPDSPASAQAGGYTLVISAGIAGGFPGLAAVGSLVVASEIIAADLGAETPDGFLSVDELGFGSSRIGVNARLAGDLAAAISAAGLPASTGPVLTVTTATGTAATAAEHGRRVPGAAAEAMEGFGVASAAKQFGLPALELRAISNAVGPRDRSAWRIGDALQALERASQILREVL
ncbi:futalosine hydrolase [Paenibacillus rhizovicinus]|uniref:Futalosine hydrolase n=1 Tax=Paenibacillus rhizovicinus TaxID=2704463 RepID=A0A6C0P994_9BACL|nr:futalosine hydrolase [Paenibacillus rhizovicinus]QHW35147.1 futalosine hydrolase [Paenibacillus rhizovicinus]